MLDVGASVIADAIRNADGPAVCAYVTAGYPTKGDFPDVLRSVAAAADVVEIGVPFTDPMADGMTIQRASRAALDDGVTFDWILESVASQGTTSGTPLLFMGYYNPFLAHGLHRLGGSLEKSTVSGMIVPDLPLEEAGPLREALEQRDLALVQLVAPTTPAHRLAQLAAASSGFVYAVTMTGVTGGRVEATRKDTDYLEQVRGLSRVPVMAGFGIRDHFDVAKLAPHVDGVIVGSALIEVIDRGDDPGDFLRSLRLSEIPA